MIQKVPVAVRSVLQLLQQIGQDRYVIAVQNREPIHVLFQIGMVRQSVKCITHTAL
jgi:hypothetical protein